MYIKRSKCLSECVCIVKCDGFSRLVDKKKRKKPNVNKKKRTILTNCVNCDNSMNEKKVNKMNDDCIDTSMFGIGKKMGKRRSGEKKTNETGREKYRCNKW